MVSGVGIHGVPQLWGRPSQTVIGRVAFAFWFLSPSVELVQAVRERACGLGVRLNHGGERPLTRRSTGRQKRTAFGSLRCAPAPVTSALGLVIVNQIFGKVFRTSDGSEFGVIRKTSAPLPEELSESDVIAEDECGNYFVRENRSIHFWDHETSKFTILANSVNEFIAGCAAPSEVELEPGQVKSVWVDPEFAKKFGIDPKP